jgi:uncharacterized membrane protein YfhO
LGAFFDGTGDYWLCIGYSSPVILALFLLFLRKKEYRTLKACFFVCAVIVLVPAFGQFLNGMSYRSNKWCWALALLCAFIFSVMWRELMKLSLGDAVKLAVGLCLCFFGLLMLDYSRTKAAFACIGIAFVFLLVLFPVRIEKPQVELRWKRYRQALALALVIAGIGSVSFFKNASGENNYANEGREAEAVEEQLQRTEANVVEQVAEEDKTTDFYRYSGRSLTNNGNVLTDLSNTQYFWSISNPYISDYMKETELIEPLPQWHTGYDDRASLLSLSSVLYYVVPSTDTSPSPYGFTYIDTFDVKGDITETAKELLMEELGTEELSDAQIKVIEDATASSYKIYRNKYALPMTYVYNTSIDESTWTKLSAVEKQEAMLQSVRLDGCEEETQDSNLEISSQSLEYTTQCNDTGVTLEDYGFVVTTANSSVTINFNGLTNSETYFSIKGLDFDGVSTHELYFGDEKYDPLKLYTKTRWKLLSYADRESVKKSWLFWSEPTAAKLTLNTSSGVSKTITYYTEDDAWYNGRHDFTVNLDYSKAAVTSLTLTFSNVGVYSFDSIEVIGQPMDSYANQISSLKSSGLDNLKIGTDTIGGTITSEQPEILCFSIPYSIGWTAYVDGKETALYQANVKNMALLLDEGTHHVVLNYHTPYLKMGGIVSAGGFAVFIVIQCCEIRKRRRRRFSAHNR